MRKTLLAVLTLVLLAPASAQALEIKNVRTLCGPFGFVRPETKFLPGDIVYLTFDILGVKIDNQRGVASYTITMEILNSQKKTIFKKPSATKVIATLGGNQIPGYAHVTLGKDQPPGAYQVKVTVTDTGVATKDSKEFTYDFELLPPTFGIIEPFAPAVGLVGQDTFMSLTLVGWRRDGKMLPNIDVTTRITDDTGKTTLAKPMSINVPGDLPDDFKEAVAKQDFVQLPLPVYLNRPGRFQVEIDAVDKVGGKSAKLKFSINVIESSPGTK